MNGDRMHLIDQLSSPIIIAHRGSSKYAPENTYASFDTALKQGAMAFELDTMLTIDHIPVVIHDRRLERTTNGKGLVDKTHSEELKKLDAGSWFSNAFKGERIPFLKDLLIRYHKNVLINIELKNLHSLRDALPDIVLELILELKVANNVILSSFFPGNLRRIRKQNRGIKTALICSSGFLGRACSSRFLVPVSPEFLHPDKDLIDEKFVACEIRRNRRINTWTVDDSDEARKYIEWGVTGLITNDPNILKQ